MIEPDLFKEVMRRHAAGVVIVSMCRGEKFHFMTATSFIPLSMHPPLVLFCVHRKSDTHDLLTLGEEIGISLLCDDQEALSRRFASKGPERYAVDDVHLVNGPGGVPLLSGSSASMEVRLINRHDGGDHSIFVGEINWAATASRASPLVYHSGQYLAVRNTADHFAL